MVVASEDINIINNEYFNSARKESEFYPFYIIKNRRSVSRRRSSIQSWQQRHRFRLVRRLVRKSGKSSIHQKTSTQRSYRFFLDLTNTLIESSWIWTLLVLSLAFVMTWVMFAGFWAIISIDNIDTWNGTDDSCLEGINSFAGYLLFSIETQTTIGYGGRTIKENCPQAIIGLCVQLLIGLGVGGTLIGIVFLKMGGPLRNRNSVVCFSKKAVICQRDGEFCLIFRVRDYDMRYECHTKIVAYLVDKRRGGELSLKVLKLNTPGILIWPVEVVHKIDSSSPFWDLSAKDLIVKRFEIVVVMEGASLATSYMSRTTTSYLNREVKWGHKFAECTTWHKESKKYIVNHKLFNKTNEAMTPLCSAQRFFEVYDEILLSQTITPYAGSIFSESSKYSSPSIMSPLIASPKDYRNSDVINNENYTNNGDDPTSSSDDEVGSTRAVVSAEIHYIPKKDDDKSVYCSSSSSDGEAFMDLSVENLTERRVRKPDSVEIRIRSTGEVRPKTLSGQAKDFLVNLQKFVTEGSGSKNRSSRKYEETSF